MAIAFDAVNGSVSFFGGGPAETATIPLTIAGNSNRILCVFIKVIINNTSPSNVKWSTSTQDYTLQGGYQITGAGSDDYWFYYLLNPEAINGSVKYVIGTSNITYTAVYSYYNVEQVAPDSTTFLLDTGTSTDWVLSNVTSVNNSWVIGAVFVSENVTYDTVVGTERFEFLDPFFSSDSLSASDNGFSNLSSQSNRQSTS